MSGGAGGSGATGATMTALNIFMKMCREEHQEMFPEEQLGTLITSLHLLHSFRFKVGGYGDKKGLCSLCIETSILFSDDDLFSKKCSERWKKMTEKEKRWFIFLEIEGRKSKSKVRPPPPQPPAVPRITPTKAKTPKKTSTPIRKSVKPGSGISNLRKRFSSGGVRKI